MRVKYIYSWNKDHPNVLEHWNAKIGDRYIWSIEEARQIDENMVIYQWEYITYEWNEYVIKPNEQIVAQYPNDFIMTKKLEI